MASTKERKFVHVWDVFNGKNSKEKEGIYQNDEPIYESIYDNHENSEIYYGEATQGVYRKLKSSKAAVDVNASLSEEFKSLAVDSKADKNHKDLKARGTVASVDSSGVETDENSTPSGSMDGKYVRNVMSSMVSDTESEGFEEEEFTIDFEAEDERPESRVTRIYDEYQGEDFSQYLHDDESQAEVQSKKRRRKPKAAKSPSASSDSSGTTRGSGIKMRLGTMFGRSSSSPYQEEDPATSTIHTYTFAHCKMGTSEDQSSAAQSRNSQTEQFSGSHWWSKSTLGAHTLSSHSDILLKARRNNDDDTVSSYSEPVASRSPKKDFDFESYRKNSMYDTTGRSKKTKPSIFRRFSKKKEDTEDLFGENCTENPLGHHLQDESPDFSHKF